MAPSGGQRDPELPHGTVSMLFSDIEGSTLLLGRLGPAYTDALDRHRAVLRSAWTAWGGTELGTEGDSFFVVFPTAPAAVSAAVQAQRGLAEQAWPGGERLRVRIGIHTGSPLVHDDDYVGMDVHRAARIAGAAHGGQVVVSAVTADLARDALPPGVGLRDLGHHRLKDLPEAEHLFQLTVDGLEANLAHLKSLGASSSLPVPATHLVGRERELVEVTALVCSAGLRLVTLTGPGGSGKTRLAVEAARQVVDYFPDGVFFVPLATVTRGEVMWTSIGEVLDAPARSRMPPGLLEQVRPLRALFVLDNLEQISGADDVVAQLVSEAPNVVVLASSRRALAVPGEQLYPVEPLALPTDASLERAQDSTAVQLFVQHARSVRPDFQLTAQNVGDVTAICRRLDGLPLAIELAAARLRLLTPQSLLRRIDQALDLASTSRQGPARQKTLRDTIAWSYALLTPTQQSFFRRMGVFAGGADLQAVEAVTDGSGDPLDLVAELVDASLVTVSEGARGEPRVAMLETIRAFARAALRAAGERDEARTLHARHFSSVAEQLKQLRESEHLLALGLAETELENFRDALEWSVQHDVGAAGTPDPTPLRLCSSLGWLWYTGGYVAEGVRWFEAVIGRPGTPPSGVLSACLAGYANLLIAQGELGRACDVASRGLAMARAVADDEREAYALGVLGTAQLQLGDVEAARDTLREALVLHRRLGDKTRLTKALGNLAGVEEVCGSYERAEELTQEALVIVRELGDAHEEAVQGQNLANLLAVSGRSAEAEELARSLVASILALRSPNLTMAFANTFMNILIRQGDPVRAAHLLGAEQAMRIRLAMPNPFEQEEHDEAWEAVKGAISVEEWERECQVGRERSVEDVLAGLA